MPSFDEFKTQGNLAFSTREYKRAAKIYRDAIAQYGDNAVIYSNRSQCFLNLQDWERAYKDAQAGLKCGPSDSIKVKLLFRMGVAAKNKSLESEAVQCFHDVLGLDRTNKGAREELDKLMAEPKLKKFKAGGSIPIPLEIVDELPREFAEIVSPSSVKAVEAKKDTNPELLDSITEELFGKKAESQKESPKIEPVPSTTDFSQMPSMHFLTALKSVPADKKEQSYHYVTNLNDSTLTSLFEASGVDHEFFEFYIEACTFVVAHENKTKTVLSKLQLMSSFHRFSLSLTMCDDKLLASLFSAVKKVSPQHSDQFSSLLKPR